MDTLTIDAKLLRSTTSGLFPWEPIKTRYAARFFVVPCLTIAVFQASISHDCAARVGSGCVVLPISENDQLPHARQRSVSTIKDALAGVASAASKQGLATRR